MSGYDTLLKELKDKDAVIRRNAIKAIIDITYFDWVRDRNERDIYFAIPNLAVALKDEDVEVRSLALQAIAIELHSFDKDCVFSVMDAIIEILFDDRRENIHAGASYILKDVVVKGYNIAKFVPKLEELLLLEGENPVKLGVTDALTFHYAINKKWDKIKELLEHEDKEIRQEAVGTLGIYDLASKVNLDPILSSLKKHLADDNDEVAFVAARSIIDRSSKVEDLTPAIELALKFAKTHPDPKIRANAIAILHNALSHNIGCKPKIPKNKWNIFQPILQYFEEIFSTSKKEIKESLTKCLTLYYLHNNQYDAIEALFKHKNPKVRSTAIYELNGCWHPCEIDLIPLLPFVVKMFVSDKNEEVRKAAETRLRDLSARKQAYAKFVHAELEIIGYEINQIWSFVEEIDKQLNIQTIKKIETEVKQLKGKEKLKKISEYLNHEDPAIRAWASYQIYILVVYEKVGVRRVIPKLVTNLEDENIFVREKSSAALSYIGEKVKIDEAIPYFAKMVHNKIYKIGYHSVYGLYQLAGQGKDISIAIPELIREINTDNKDLRYFIKEAIERFIINKERLQFLMLLTEQEDLSKYKAEILKIIEERKTKLLDLAKRYESMSHTSKQAIDTYTTYLNTVPEDSTAWYQLALFHEKNNNLVQAMEACKKSLEFNPEFESAQNLIKKLQKLE